MRCSHKLIVLLMVLAACGTALAQSRPYNLGTPASEDDIRALGLIIGPQGKELPPGNGTAKEGAEIFSQQCRACHGTNGEGGMANQLVLGSPGNPHQGPFKENEGHPISYFASATTLWDYINRAMPPTKPGSLSAEQVYALTALLLFRNGIIAENDVLDAKSLPKVQMPNRDGFVPAVPVWPPAPKKPSWW